MTAIVISGALATAGLLLAWLLQFVTPPGPIRTRLRIIIPTLFAVFIGLTLWQAARGNDAALSGTLPAPDPGPSCEPVNAGEHATETVSVDVLLRTDGCWATRVSPVVPGTTVEYMIAYANGGDELQRDVVARVNVPPGASLVPNSTYLANSSNPDGVLVATNQLTTTGMVIGSYHPGAAAYVKVRGGNGLRT